MISISSVPHLFPFQIHPLNCSQNNPSRKKICSRHFQIKFLQQFWIALSIEFNFSAQACSKIVSLQSDWLNLGHKLISSPLSNLNNSMHWLSKIIRNYVLGSPSLELVGCMGKRWRPGQNQVFTKNRRKEIMGIGQVTRNVYYTLFLHAIYSQVVKTEK